MVNKKILFTCLLILFAQAAFANNIPVKITPAQIISTHHDEIELGDYINFKIVKDVYVDNKLYLKKDTPITGFVEFFHENGWAGDSAEISFNKFRTRDVNGREVIINYPLKLVGNNLKANDIKQSLALNLTIFVQQILALIRGSEIKLEPESKIFNLFITQLNTK